LIRAYINADVVPPNGLEMIAKDQIDMDEEMDRLIILAGKIEITCNG
jgi:hypothetical protein